MEPEIFRFRHRDKNCLGVKISREDHRNQEVRKLPGIRWSRTHGCWYGEDTPALEEGLKRIPGFQETLPAAINADRHGKPGPDTPDAGLLSALSALKDYMKVKRYSIHSIENYSSTLMMFLRYFKDRDWRMLDEKDMAEFQKKRIIDRNLSSSYQNVVLNAIRLFYLVNTGKVLQPGFIERPRRSHVLPKVMSQEQLKKLFTVVKNPKHRTMLSLIYSCGLRAGELLNLRIHDVDSSRGFLQIRGGKGKKDRQVPLSHKTLEMLRNYYRAFKPQAWLFEGQASGSKYSARSLQLVFKKGLKKAGITNPFTLHSLRHSYATHLLEAGTNLRVIQEVLGHKSSRTTEIYTHVSNTLLQRLKSPFDDLF